MVRRPRLGILASVIIIFFFSLFLSYIGCWYFIAIPSAFAGLLTFRIRSVALSSLASPVGVIVAMSPDISYRISQASLFSSVAGIPGGPALPLVLLVVMSYLFAMLPMAIVSSFGGKQIQ